MEAFIQGGHTFEIEPGLYRKLAYHLVMNNFTVPQALEGLKADACSSFAKSFHEIAALNRAIDNGAAAAAFNRHRMLMARTDEFSSAINSAKMVDAWEVTRLWNKQYLHAAGLKLAKDFVELGIDLKKMRPRDVVEQMAKAQDRGQTVMQPAMERARYVMLYEKPRTCPLLAILLRSTGHSHQLLAVPHKLLRD